MALFVHWNLNPEIFTIGNWGPRWYGLLFAMAFICGYYIMLHMFKKEGQKQELLDSLTIYMFLGTLLGARLGHCLFYEPAYYLSHPLQIFAVWKGGLASHGAAIGILIALFYFQRKHKKDYFWTLDRIVVVTALGGFFIRLGNLANSEIVGNPTNLAWGFIFEQLGEDFPRHPSQLYEAVSYLFIFIVLLWLYKNYKAGEKRGLLFGLFLIAVFGARFLIEFTKEIQVDFEQNMALDMGQWLSIPFILAGFYFAYKALKPVQN